MAVISGGFAKHPGPSLFVFQVSNMLVSQWNVRSWKVPLRPPITPLLCRIKLFLKHESCLDTPRLKLPITYIICFRKRPKSLTGLRTCVLLTRLTFSCQPHFAALVCLVHYGHIGRFCASYSLRSFPTQPLCTHCSLYLFSSLSLSSCKSFCFF